MKAANHIVQHEQNNEIIELQPINLSPEEQEKRRRQLWGELEQESTFAPALPETPIVAPSAAPAAVVNVPHEVAAHAAVKASTVSSAGDGAGWKILGGALLLGGVGAAVAGGGGGRKSQSSQDNHSSNQKNDVANNAPKQPETPSPTKTNVPSVSPTNGSATSLANQPTESATPTQKAEPTLNAPIVGWDGLPNISQSNQNQSFVLSGSLKADPNATQTTVSLNIGGKNHKAQTVGEKWTLTLSGSELVQKQGENAVEIGAISQANGKTVQGQLLAAYFVDTHITTPQVTLNKMADKLTTDTQTVTLSGSLNGVDADASAVVRVQINGGEMKTAKVSGNTWTLTVPASEMVAKLGENRVDVSAIATDKFGNTAQHAIGDVYQVGRPTETQIIYASGKMDSVSGSTAHTFDGKNLLDTAKILKNENEILQRYISAKGETAIENNIVAAYAHDSDHDGVIDAFDRNPNTWDVSERDLRMFATLAYGKENQLAQLVRAVNEPDTPHSKQILADFYANDNVNNRNSFNFNGQSKLEEILKDWKILGFYNYSDAPIVGNGLDYAIFGNGKKADGSYENVVVAFRGTSNIADVLSDVKLAFGFIPVQAKATEWVLKDLAQYNPDKIYVTGHSLGGYLAQFFIGDYLLQSKFKDKFVHSAIFNPAILNPHEFSNSRLHNAREITDKLLKNQYIDNSDMTQPTYKQYTTSYVVDGDFVSEEVGWYANTTWIDERNAISFTLKNHALISFSQKDPQLKQLFSKGYRMDTHYLSDDTDKDGLTDYQEKRIGTDFRTATALNGKDTDRDGFSDHLEIKLGSNWQNADDRVEVSSFVARSEWDSPILAVAATHTTDDSHAFLGATGYLLSPTAKGNDLTYAPTGTNINLGIANHTEWQTWLDSGSKIINGTHGNDTLSGSDTAQILFGGAGNDVLQTGNAQTVLVGGDGTDTFQFTASSLLSGSLNIVSDLNANDKLDFSASRELFSDRNVNFKWSDVLGENAAAFQNQSALIWQDDSKTLAYKSSQSHDLHVFARFDDSQTLASIQAAIVA